MPEPRWQWYSDDPEVIGKIEYDERLTALIVSTKDTGKSIDIVRTDDATDYAYMVLVDENVLHAFGRAGHAEALLHLIGNTMHWLLKEIDDEEEMDNGSGD